MTDEPKQEITGTGNITIRPPTTEPKKDKE